MSESGQKCSCRHEGTICGTLWIAGWLFVVGYLHPSFWRALLALVLWPAYLGAALR